MLDFILYDRGNSGEMLIIQNMLAGDDPYESHRFPN